MTNVRQILETKGSSIWSVTPQVSVKETLKLMAEKNVGAVLVLEEGRIAGIFSERDFARHTARNTISPENILVKDMMTTRIIVVTPNHTMADCLALMSSKRIRHLPVLENEKLIGLISIGDVVNRIIKDQEFSITQLEKYVTGEV